MNTAQSMTKDTQAVITVLDAGQSAYGPNATAPTQLVNTVGFSYSSDVLQLGDAFSVQIPNPRGLYTSKFLRGQTVQLFLRHPDVNGNAQTLKHMGVIVRRTQSVSERGSVIQIDCADLGWHLVSNAAPLWYRLQNVQLRTLLTDPAWIDPSWGIRGLTTDKTADKLIRQGVRNGRAQAALDLQNAALGTLAYIQVEPGDMIADTIAQYCRRINRLVNVSCDGFLTVFLPDYRQEASYRIDFHGFDESSRTENTVLDVQISEDITSIYTEVICVGEIVGGDLTQDPSQNATKRRGAFVNPSALPFVHRTSFADGDIFDKPTAAAQALWRYNRGIFDSWQAVYVVRGHWQAINGQRALWWESDAMCSVNDSVNGLAGNFYVASVRCDRDEKGDRTTVTLRKPVLSASFGVYKNPPRITGSIVDYSGTTTSTGQKTQVNK